MKKIYLPKSVRKFIRKEKARIRREILEVEKQKEAINKLYERFMSMAKIQPADASSKIKIAA